MLRLSLRILALVGIGLEVFGVLSIILMGAVGIVYLTLLAAERWPGTGLFLGALATIIWSVVAGALSKLYVMARQSH